MIVYNESQVASEDGFHGIVGNLPKIVNNHAEHITELIDKVDALEKEVKDMELADERCKKIIELVYNFVVAFHVGPDRVRELKKEMEDRKNDEFSKTRMDESNDANDS